MRDIEKIKKEIKDLEIQNLADIIRKEPLIAGESSTLFYNKKQREELKSCMLEITKKDFRPCRTWRKIFIRKYE